MSLILPAEMKVCATCSYWDGVRKVDTEVGVVVVADGAAGECLVKESERRGLHSVRHECNCEWEHIAPDPVGEDDEPITAAA